jgi:hypothetical protein
MANPNEDDRLQRVLQRCWCIHQTKLMQPGMQLSRKQLYNILILVSVGCICKYGKCSLNDPF